MLIFLLLTGINSLRGETFHLPPFIYDYDGLDSDKVISQLDANLRQRLPEVEAKLDVTLPPRVRIYLTLTREEFYRKTRGRVPGWAGGVAVASQNLIIVKAPLFFGQGVPLEVLTMHELVHILLHKATEGRYIPQWLNEGLAQVLAGESRHGSLTVISRAAFADRLMGLPRVDNVLSFSSPDASLAYTEARSATAWFVDRFGWLAVRTLIANVRADLDFDEAFFRATGVGYEAFQIEWMKYARNHYKLWILLEVDSLIWYLILVLAVLAIITTFIRRKRQLRKMTDEDDEEDDLDNTPIHP